MVKYVYTSNCQREKTIKKESIIIFGVIYMLSLLRWQHYNNEAENSKYTIIQYVLK